MIINYEYDVFIAFFNSGEAESFNEAEEIKDYLEGKGLKCFLFEDRNRGGNCTNYRSTFINIMQSRFFLLVVNGDGIYKYEKNGKKYDFSKHYYVNVEIDAFLALTQEHWREAEDSGFVCFTSNTSDDKIAREIEKQYTLFGAQSLRFLVSSDESIYKEKGFDNIFNRINAQIHKENIMSNEVVGVYKNYADSKEKFIAKLTKCIKSGEIRKIRCMGINNSFLSSNHRNLIEDAVKKGAALEFFFLEPNSEGARIRAKERTTDRHIVSRDDISIESITGMRSLCEGLARRNISEEQKNKVTFYLFDNVPRQNMSAF